MQIFPICLLAGAGNGQHHLVKIAYFEKAHRGLVCGLEGLVWFGRVVGHDQNHVNTSQCLGLLMRH